MSIRNLDRRLARVEMAQEAAVRFADLDQLRDEGVVIPDELYDEVIPMSTVRYERTLALVRKNYKRDPVLAARAKAQAERPTADEMGRAVALATRRGLTCFKAALDMVRRGGNGDGPPTAA